MITDSVMIGDSVATDTDTESDVGGVIVSTALTQCQRHNVNYQSFSHQTL